MAGAARKLKRERNENMSQAWHMAAFQRAKKMPRLKDVIDEPRRKSGRMTPEQLQATVAGWLSKRKKR